LFADRREVLFFLIFFRALAIEYASVEIVSAVAKAAIERKRVKEILNCIVGLREQDVIDNEYAGMK